MARRVLHVLSQRPGRTGSGVTLEALVREASAAGWDQEVVVGVPAEEGTPAIGGLDAARVHPVRFGVAPLAFALPGMSDVMPYTSSRWRDLTTSQLAAYRDAWRAHLACVVERFRPDVIHGHHLWLAGSLLKDVAPDVPVVLQSHATGLRQRSLCPHLADETARGCARADRVLVLTHELGRKAADALGIVADRIAVVGAGFRDDLFHARGRSSDAEVRILYAGKLSCAKGLPWLLDAFERVAASMPRVRLHVAGSGGGEEAEGLRRRMEAMAPRVVLHGHVDQPRLAEVMRVCSLFVLPSFYEGLPLVVAEAVASGCRVVCTDLPTVREELAPALGSALALVPLPGLVGVDEPLPEGLPRFVDELEAALCRGLEAGALAATPPALERFTWRAVFERVERVWHDVLPGP